MLCATLMFVVYFSGGAALSSSARRWRWGSSSNNVVLARRLAPLSSSSPSSTSESAAVAAVGGSAASVTVPSGLVAILKPKNWTSSDVVMKVKGVLLKGMQHRCNGKFKLKIGHGGTLDPLAEGVLVLGVGEGTKLMSQYLEGSKGYQAVACLGAETDTLDCTGEVVERVDCSGIDTHTLDAALARFRGDIQQVPPMYSALKRDGKKLYELARAGIEVEREARNVSVYSLRLTPTFPEADGMGLGLGHEKRELQLPLFGLDISSRWVGGCVRTSVHAGTAYPAVAPCVFID